MANDNAEADDLRIERRTPSKRKAKNHVSEMTIPAVIRIPQPPRRVSAPLNEELDDLDTDFDGPSSSMQREREAQERVTVEDLQAMKRMVREIQDDPQRFFDYSPSFLHFARGVARGGRADDSDDGDGQRGERQSQLPSR